MKVFKFGADIINCQDDDPQIAHMQSVVDKRDAEITRITEANVSGAASAQEVRDQFNEAKATFETDLNEGNPVTDEIFSNLSKMDVPPTFSPQPVPDPIEFEEITVDFQGLERFASAANTTFDGSAWSFNVAAVEANLAIDNTVAAKRLLAQQIDAIIEVGGNSFQVDDKSRQAISEAISVGGSHAWTLADNSVETLTATQLEDVLGAFVARRQGLIDSFNTWRSGDRLTAWT